MIYFDSDREKIELAKIIEDSMKFIDDECQSILNEKERKL